MTIPGYRRTGLIMVCAWLWAGPALASMCEIQLGAQFQEQAEPARATALRAAFPWGGQIRLVNESYDQFLAGEQVRWGLAGGYEFSVAGLGIITAGGLGLSSSRELRNQLSLDVFVRVSYWYFCFEADQAFFQNGLHATHLLALAWPFAIGPTTLSPMIGVGAFLNTDYVHALYPIRPFAGVRYAF